MLHVAQTLVWCRKMACRMLAGTSHRAVAPRIAPHLPEEVLHQLAATNGLLWAFLHQRVQGHAQPPQLLFYVAERWQEAAEL